MTNTQSEAAAQSGSAPRTRPAVQSAKFYSIVVHSSGASEIEMTGKRDTARQDRELATIFHTRESPG